MRRQLKTGELTELEFEASVFHTGPNANHVRFRPEDLPNFAASFRNQPFLRNHNTADIDARDGTIVNSNLAGNEFHQTIRLTTERGIRSFLDGIMDRFSIGWHFSGITCSICNSDWMKCTHYPGRTYTDSEGNNPQTAELIFDNPRGKETSAVNTPAVHGTHILSQLLHLKEESNPMPHILLPDGTTKTVAEPAQLAAPPAAPIAITTAPPADKLMEDMRQLQAQIHAERIEQLIVTSNLSATSKEAVRLASPGKTLDDISKLIDAQRKVEAEQQQQHIVKGIRPIMESMMHTPLDRVQTALDWIFGLQVAAPPPQMRSIRDIYQAITGDHNWYGIYNPEWAQLALGTTTTLAGLVVNALNKVILQHYDNLATYRWYEPIVAVMPHDGTTHAVQMIHVDGIANLPVVAEGAAYTEATVGDSKESATFTKYGHYVGITLESIRRSDIQRIQAIPRELVKAAIRTRSAKIAAIFTQASGTGPTLADDSTVLFHADHGNVTTTAFSYAAWGAARTRIWEQTIPGTSKPLGLWPTFCLLPIELFDTALEAFGYGSGDVGKPATDAAHAVNPYSMARLGDPRAIPIAVPDWTDANDWAYIVDPRLHPVIHMAYANAPQGNQHPLPEIYEVTSETQGLMFTNDTLPVKCRDWWTYGVSTHVGVGKNNVA